MGQASSQRCLPENNSSSIFQKDILCSWESHSRKEQYKIVIVSSDKIWQITLTQLPVPAKPAGQQQTMQQLLDCHMYSEISVKAF